MRRIDLRGATPPPSELRAALPRAAVDTAAAAQAVRPLIDRVRDEGAAALYDLGERFDHVRPRRLRVPGEAIERALAELDPRVREALELSIAHNRMGHLQQMPHPDQVEVVPGGVVSQRWIPVARVGLYVPGGLAVYPSSVVMNAVAAQVAGVGSLALASPPQAAFDGLPHPTILAACALLGVTEVWAVGGAQAIAALALGFADGQDACEPVDVITGPGNIYVAAAKRLVRGIVGIDAEAGTTEIAVLADDSADPVFVAADLISQAEHDPAAASVLITDSPVLADAVEREIPGQAGATRHTERILQALSGPQSGIVLVDDTDAGLRVVDAYAPEHLEVHTRDSSADARRVRTRRRGLRRPVLACAGGRLHRRLQPRPAHGRDGPVLQRAQRHAVPALPAGRRVLGRGAVLGRRAPGGAGRGGGPARARGRRAHSAGRGGAS